MKNLMTVLWVSTMVFLLIPCSSNAAEFKDANIGSIVVRDGTLWTSLLGHAAVVIIPPKGDSTVGRVMQTDISFSKVAGIKDYDGFMDKKSNKYMGHFRTTAPYWNDPAFRANVVMFANLANYKKYTFLNIYAYPWIEILGVPADYSRNNAPSFVVRYAFKKNKFVTRTPTDFRCDGLAEWSVERALGMQEGGLLSASKGFYGFNEDSTGTSISIQPLEMTTKDLPIAGINHRSRVDSAYVLSVSSPDNTVIKVDKIDSLGNQNITTAEANRLYSAGTIVTLAAPERASGKYFTGWVNDNDWVCMDPNNIKCKIKMDAKKKVSVEYRSSVQLSVQASTSWLDHGKSRTDFIEIPITVSDKDLYSKGDGDTYFTRHYKYGTKVTLEAPAQVGIYSFKDWEKAGCTNYVSGAVCEVSMGVGIAHTMVNYEREPTAIYELTVKSTIPILFDKDGNAIQSTLLPNVNADKDINGDTNAPTPFARSYYDDDLVKLTAAPSHGIHRFNSWLGCKSTKSNVCYVKMDKAKIVTANYKGLRDIDPSMMQKSNSQIMIKNHSEHQMKTPVPGQAPKGMPRMFQQGME